MSDVNPKELQAAAEGKAPLDFLEPALDVPLALVMEHGAGKYGYRNYTVTPCKVRTYIGAIQRHLRALRLGEDIDPDSGQPHWAHIAACCAVVLGCQDAGLLVDDREAYATKRSDAVHIDGNRDAKSDSWVYEVPAVIGQFTPAAQLESSFGTLIYEHTEKEPVDWPAEQREIPVLDADPPTLAGYRLQGDPSVESLIGNGFAPAPPEPADQVVRFAVELDRAEPAQFCGLALRDADEGQGWVGPGCRHTPCACSPTGCPGLQEGIYTEAKKAVYRSMLAGQDA